MGGQRAVGHLCARIRLELDGPPVSACATSDIRPCPWFAKVLAVRVLGSTWCFPSRMCTAFEVKERT